MLLCAGLTAVYLAVTLWQFFQLGRHPVGSVNREPSVGPQVPFDAASGDDVSLAAQLRRANVTTELQRLNRAIVLLQADLLATRDELRQLRSESRAWSHASPYDEAIEFARHGIDAAGIASRCGISRGEAELVTALARDPKNRGPEIRNAAWQKTANQHNEQEHERYRAAA
jgi:hypothetical protein